MAQGPFPLLNAEGVLLDRRGRCVEELIEAYDCAIEVVHNFISRPSMEDWRKWILHVSDGDGEEIFALPFSSLLGRPH